jgi:23S rRNA pseudouridine2605 synthase
MKGRSTHPSPKPQRFRKPHKPAAKKVTTADTGLIRLNKYIANAGIASRREADDLIEAGVISVNGEIITTLGYKVKPGDVVKYNDSKLHSEKLVYLLLNKPKDYITTVEDTHDRKTVMSLVANAVKERIYPVGRLDRNTTGLLIFTNDGDLARKLTHPSFQAQKIYEVHLDKNLKPEHFEEIEKGIKLEDGFIKPDEISYSQESRAIIGVELHSGRNRIVRRRFEHFGYRIKKLDRVVYASLTKKNLPRGKWRFLLPVEVANLKMAVGRVKL